jgi:hypothetical protein
MGYVIFDPMVNKPLHELPRDEAREAYDWFLANVGVRVSELSRLVGEMGIILDFSEDSLAPLHSWFFDLVNKEKRLGNSTPSPELFSVCNDIGVYLSEFVIRRGKQVKWLFYTGEKKALSYQRPVIAGFNVKNKDYHIDFDYLICQYAFRIFTKGAKEDNLFTLMINKALTLI